MKQFSKWLIVLLLCVTVVSTTIAVWVVCSRSAEAPDAPLVPDHAPEIEEQASPIPNDTSEKPAPFSKGCSVSLTYSDQVTVDLSDKTASLIFANPKKSNQDLVLQIVIQDVVLGQSGRLVAGNQISALTLSDHALARLETGGYEGKFAVFYYSQETGEKAAVNTEIPITISVKK